MTTHSRTRHLTLHAAAQHGGGTRRLPLPNLHAQSSEKIGSVDAQDAFDISNLEQTDSPSLVAAVP